MDTFDTLDKFGYIRQITPAGRVIMVNPAFYPLTDEFLANEDDYAEECADYAFDIYEDECDYENDEY